MRDGMGMACESTGGGKRTGFAGDGLSSFNASCMRRPKSNWFHIYNMAHGPEARHFWEQENFLSVYFVSSFCAVLCSLCNAGAAPNQCCGPSSPLP